MSEKRKQLVYLREKKRSNGLRSLFLDYKRDGKRVAEYLRLYLVPEVSRADIAQNRETLRMAEAIRAQRVLELQAAEMGVEQMRGDVSFFDFVRRIIERKAGTTRTSWRNCLAHLLRYEGDEGIFFSQITRRWVRGFRDYLEFDARQWDIDGRKREVEPKPLSQGTKALMFQKLCAVFNEALREGVISRNPAAGVERFKEPESEREFLTVEELRRLRGFPAPYEVLGRAFFFSCLTGLRWSDIVKLRWDEVQQWQKGVRIVFRQKKTGGLEYLDLNPQAAVLMGERGRGDAPVFEGLGTIQAARIGIAAWVRGAGIEKHITFHCARHTFAVMMLEQGVDIYTLSKLLGHKSIETTQVYARIVDARKQDAVLRIPDIL